MTDVTMVFLKFMVVQGEKMRREVKPRYGFSYNLDRRGSTSALRYTRNPIRVLNTYSCRYASSLAHKITHIGTRW